VTLAEEMDVSLWRVNTCLEAAGEDVHYKVRLLYYITERAHRQEGAQSIIIERVGASQKGYRPASCYVVVQGFSE
jgi:hypothetical protein